MKRVFLLIAILLLLLSGCDRYDNEFEKSLTDFLNEFSDMMLTIHSPDQLDQIMQYYNIDYLNSGTSYSDIREYFETLLQNSYDSYFVSIDRFSEGEVSRVQWTLFGEIEDYGIAYIYTFIDCVRIVDGEDKFVGNGAAQEFYNYRYAFQYDLEEAILASDMSIIEPYFTEDYYNNGLDRDSLFFLLDDISPALGFELGIIDFDTFECTFVYELTENSTGKTLLVDDTYTVVDGEYKFCGNGEEAPDTSKQKVLVELFTGTWCPNCPTSEQVLHDLKEQYGDSFYYIEYHISDAYDGFYADNDDLLDYYLGGIECPTAVFQGQFVRSGGISDQSQYEMPLNDYMTVDARAFFDSASANWDAETHEVSVSIDVTLDEYLDDNDLYLRYAIVEETAQASTSGGYYHQAVIAKGDVPFEGNLSELNDEFSISYESGLPDDAILYLWLQTLHNEHANDCKVHNVIEVTIEGL